MDKMRFKTPDMVEKNINRIVALFLNCATEILGMERSKAEKKVCKRTIQIRYIPKDDLRANLAENCVPESFMDMDVSNYQVFLDTRRTMMAQYIWEYYESLA